MKNPLMKIKKTKEFIDLIVNNGYTTSSKGNGSSHVVYQKPGYPNLSVPDKREIAPGTLRELLKRMEGEGYYNR